MVGEDVVLVSTLSMHLLKACHLTTSNCTHKSRKTYMPNTPTHSAYRSGLLVQEYKRRGGSYSGKHDDGLKQWFAAEWKISAVKQATNTNLMFTDLP